jgi:hypothetical protein
MNELLPLLLPLLQLLFLMLSLPLLFLSISFSLSLSHSFSLEAEVQSLSCGWLAGKYCVAFRLSLSLSLLPFLSYTLISPEAIGSAQVFG